MVRRWSHISSINLTFSKFFKFEKKHKIVNFKSSVNLKRFTFKLTKFRRKSMARFKHTANWLLYTSIIKFWSIDYLFFKHFCKMQFFNKIFINNFISYNFNFTKIRNDLFSYNFNFFFSTWSKRSYSHFNNSNFPFLNNNITFVWYQETPITGNSVKLVYGSWDNIMYPTNLLKIDNLFSNNFDLNHVFSSIFDVNIKNLIEIKKILILLFYYKLNFKNVK